MRRIKQTAMYTRNVYGGFGAFSLFLPIPFSPSVYRPFISRGAASSERKNDQRPVTLVAFMARHLHMSVNDTMKK